MERYKMSNNIWEVYLDEQFSFNYKYVGDIILWYCIADLHSDLFFKPQTTIEEYNKIIKSMSVTSVENTSHNMSNEY